MRKLGGERTLYYGKGDVFVYRTHASPLFAEPIPESPYRGDNNVVFAHNVKFSVGGEAFLSSFADGDNGRIVATDSMKNFILREAASYAGSTTEGLLADVAAKFFAQYPHVSGIDIEAERLPFERVAIAGQGGVVENSALVYRRSRDERGHARFEYVREGGGVAVVGQTSGMLGLQLIKVSGSSFYGFIRDEYTTLPESYDRPLFIYLDIRWSYADPDEALGGRRYVAPEQVRDIAQQLFHEVNSPSIQHLLYLIGRRMLTRFPQLATVGFESNNRTWETVVEPIEAGEAGVYTEPRPPFGFQGFSMSREDVREEGGG